MEELKKCPFCGGEASLIKTTCLNNNYEDILCNMNVR